MLNEQTILKLESMKLFGMAKTFREIMSNSKSPDLSHSELAGLLADSEKTYRENKRLKRLLHNAKLKQQACTEDLDYKNHRGLNKQVILELSNGDWIRNHQNILISGATGVGKTYIACALGNCACRLGYSVFYVRAQIFWTSMYQSRADGSYLKYINKLSKTQVLIIDDLGLSPMNDQERKDLFEIVEEATFKSSMIISSQLPIKEWYQNIGDPTIADAICDRLLNNSYKIELKGDSMRKKKENDK